MNNRERALAILNYEEYDRMPVVHFGFWQELIQKWQQEGHITKEESMRVYDGSKNEEVIAERLGFDFNWRRVYTPNTGLSPAFEKKVLEQSPDGFRTEQTPTGSIVKIRDGAGSIPAHVGTLLKGRKEWEKLYKPKLQFSEERINDDVLASLKDVSKRENLMGLRCGSLFGEIRNYLTVEGLSYLYVDDEELYTEIIDTVGDLTYKCVKYSLESGAKFDFAHFWEDICFKTGPLVVPSVFEEKVGPHYKKITDLVRSYGIDIISLDCDGQIDTLVPIWLKNGVNTMFPIEVGTWNGNIKPWREKYGKKIRGVGGMDKKVFAQDYAAIDAEIERLKPLIELGAYIPCPDHRIPLDAIWENVQYYCEKIREEF